MPRSKTTTLRVVEFAPQRDLSFQLSGRFRVTGRDGTDVTPKSRKAQALLAMVVQSPDFERSRSWLQKTLWGRQDDAQAFGSLRQAVHAIRKAFGPYKDAIVVGGGMVKLDAARIEIAPQEAGADQTARVFLEGLEIAEPGYDVWLRAQRGEQVASTETDVFSQRPDAARLPAGGLRLFLGKFDDEGLNPSRDLSDMLSEQVAQMIAERANIEVLPQSSVQGEFTHTDLILRSTVHRSGEKTAIRIRIEFARSGSTLWAGVRTVPASLLDALEHEKIRKFLNMAVDAALAEYAELGEAYGLMDMPALQAINAVRIMFRLGADNLTQADQMLETAYAADPQAIYLAWRAFQRVMMQSECPDRDVALLRREAETYLRIALEKAPHNAMVMALGSYVHAALLHNFPAALTLAKGALEFAPCNPFAWAFLGIARMHLGHTELAHKHTMHARAICGPGPHRYQFDLMACQTACVLGRFEDAIEMGETVRAAAPSYAPPLRYLAALMLATNRTAEAESAISDLRKLEPGFSIAKMLDHSYPAAALRRSPLISSLIRRRAKVKPAAHV